VQSEVFQAHVEQELQAVADLLEQFARDLPAPSVEVQVAEEIRRRGERHFADLDDGFAGRRGSPAGGGAGRYVFCGTGL